MVKTYLRYAQKRVFGVINSPTCNVVVGGDGSVAITGALADVTVWHLRRGELLRRFQVQDKVLDASVSCVALNEAGTVVAAGYTDGSIRLWNMEDLNLVTGRHGSGTGLMCTLNGHRGVVSTVHFNANGSQLVSGGADTDVVMWDVVGRAGLFRLRGHRDQVTDAVFFAGSKRLITSSKDTLLKVWDLDTQHCIQTCVGHRTEVWSMSMNRDETRLATGSGDSQLRIWKVSAAGTLTPQTVDGDAEGAGVEESKQGAAVIPTGQRRIQDAGLSASQAAVVSEKVHLELFGSLGRPVSQRVQTVRYSRDGSLLLCQGAGKTVEVYRTRSEDGAKKKFNRRRKRAREKARAMQEAFEQAKAHKASSAVLAEAQEKAEAAAAAVEAVTEVPTDEFELVTVIRSSHKARSAAFCIDGARSGASTARILIAAQSNLLDVYGVDLASTGAAGTARFTKMSSLNLPGHRSAVRAVSVSPDDQMLLTVSKNAAKVWNAATGQCIRTLATGFGLCCAFDPAASHALIGCKNGQLQLFDLSSGDATETHDAHEGAVWSLDVRPDGKGLCTGSADKSVKFWNFDLVEDDSDDDESGAPSGLSSRLGVVHTRTLKMSDDVLCVRYSNTRDSTKLLLAVALLDCTVKVFHEDTLKFFLSLYGHRLPVMSMAISTDNTMLVSASADKNVKLWGLDFGDCHKSLFAHTDSVMSVDFIPKTHLFFSAGKDGVINYWDGDRFELISTLSGHRGEVWGVGIAHDGSYMASVSHDRSVRVWERTDEQVFLEEEKEKRLEEMFEKEAGKPRAAEVGLPETGRAGTETKVTVQAADSILEALGLVRDELSKWREYVEDLRDAEAGLSAEQVAARRKMQADGKSPPTLVPVPQHNPLLLGLTPTRYLLKELRGIRAADLEEALHALPFAAARELLRYLLHWLRKGLVPELCCKCVLFLVKLHNNQLVADASLRRTLVALNRVMRDCVASNRNAIGFNRAGLRMLKRRIENQGQDGQAFGDDQPEVVEESKVVSGRGKRRRYQLF